MAASAKDPVKLPGLRDRIVMTCSYF